ncbi:MAG: glycosyltransferase [Methylomarinum sp.]|nr:glycosyltransferase [Methylomarinum sp.]
MTINTPPFGFNVIGFVSGNLGLGHTTRQFIQVLLNRGFSVCILDDEANYGRSNFDNTFKHLCVANAEELPYAVNLSIFGAISLSEFVLYPPKGLQVEGRLNVALVWWELTEMPEYWYQAGRLFDALIAGSNFVHATLSNNISGIPILLAPHPIQIPEKIIPNRNHFGLPEDVFLTLMGFEPHSDPIRKNPFGAIEAFKKAFKDRKDCHLVIKVNNPNVKGKNLKHMDYLYDLTSSDSRIHLIQDSLPYETLLSLYASCDAFISLHRSEGLGLIPLEAMRLGKPVVATGWSGNMSYMNNRNACLVGFDFKPTDNNSHIYGRKALGINAFWADPDIKQAAYWLKKLADDPIYRAKIGECAAIDSAYYQEQANQAEFADELKTIWDNRELWINRNKHLILQEIRVSFHNEKLRHLPVIPRFYNQARNFIKTILDRHLFWRFKKNK